MRTAIVTQTRAALIAAGVFAAGAVGGWAHAATLTLPSASLPLIGVAYQSTGAGAGCFSFAGVCVTPGPFVQTSATSTFAGGDQSITAEATYSAKLTTLIGNTIIGSVSLTGTLDETVLGRTSNTETGSFVTDITSISLSGPLSLPSVPLLDGHILDVTLNPSDASSGTTTIEADGSVFKIDSFFDVFADVSLEGTPLSKVLPGITLVAVPELSTWAMVLAGFAGLGLAARRRARFAAG